MAAEAPSWVAVAAVDRMVVEAATAWAPEPTRSTAVGTSIARIGTAITSTRIGTATRAILHTVVLAGGGLQTDDACGCAATSARTTDTGTAISGRTIGTATATIARTVADTHTAADTRTVADIGKAVTSETNAARPSGSPARRAGEPLSEPDSDRSCQL